MSRFAALSVGGLARLLVLSVALLPTAAGAQGAATPAPNSAPNPATAASDPVVAKVDGQPIRMSDDIVDLVSAKWPSLGLPGSGAPIWKKP